MAKKFVYLFSEGKGSMRDLLGGKGANLAEMTNLGLPVPTGFTITTQACIQYYQDHQSVDPLILEEVFVNLKTLETLSGKRFGDATNPLLVSVRSGARASMPGMMDTILNLGINDAVVAGVAKLTDNPRFAYDSYRRFIQMFADVVKELPKSEFEGIIDAMKRERGITLDNEFSAEDLMEMVARFKEFYASQLHEAFPQDPTQQLMAAIEAVFRSWNNPRAIYYRRMNEIPNDWGTAVNVQTMVFGNMGDDCATGVAFTRNPSTGERQLYGEFLVNAQGEDVVAGVRTPQTIDALEKILPEAYHDFVKYCGILENHYRDMQDMEFTIEHGKLYMLQTRNGKRTAFAALKIAVDLVAETLITKEEAILQIDPRSLDTVLHPTFNPEAIKQAEVIGSALPASPGAACGCVAFSAERAIKMTENGKDVILVRLETSPEDIEGMHSAKGILTARGGMTSHAAVVARGMGRCCVSGCSDLVFDDEKSFTLGGYTFVEGDEISLDGSTGKIYKGRIATIPATISGDFETIMKWADDVRELKIRTNADTPHDAIQARAFGAEGIGLVRTEHMFFDVERIKAMREMIVSKSGEQRERALQKILPMQRSDFEGIYEAMEGLPVTIRYLDPPLHEFLPTADKDIRSLAKEMKMDHVELRNVIISLHEFNPMMGHRGCRLAVSHPEIAAMQTRAVIEAAMNVQTRHPDWTIVPEIMIPLVGAKKELAFVKAIVDAEAEKVFAERNQRLDYHVGTMIEVPRACVVADDIADEADFFSFGTNDLTQMTFGFSRDDAAKFLPEYYNKGIYEQDPFQRLDQVGVGALMKMAIELGRKRKPELKMGICGEHGGDPSSIDFCQRLHMNYVSCSPYRVPIARLAAAQSKLRQDKNKV